MLFLRSHRLRKLVGLGKHVAALAHAGGELKLCPLLAGAFAFQDVDVEIGKLGIREIEVRTAVGVVVKQVGAGPVEDGHEIVADGMDALGREVAEAFLVHLYLLVAVGTAIFNGLHHRQRLHHAPAHAITLDILSQVPDLLTGPYFAQGHVVQGGDNTFNSDLTEHGKRYLVVLAKPSPCPFHNIFS